MKKRLIAVTFGIFFFFVANIVGAVQGDVDGSNSIDLKDVILPLQVFSGLKPSPISVQADVNGDLRVGLEEAIFALQVVAGIRPWNPDKLLPDLLTYTFSVLETKILPGTSTESVSGWNCTGTITSEDQIGNLALVALFYQNGCYTSGVYNHNDYKVERGAVEDQNNQFRFDAYKIYEPTHKATQFLASNHVVYYKFPTQEDYTVYIFDGNKIAKVAYVEVAKINVNQFIKIESLNTSKISGSVIYLFVPSKQRVSQFTQIATGIEGARVRNTELGDVLKYRYEVNGIPFDTASDFDWGPDSWRNIYSMTRQFFMVRRTTGQIGVVWQDKADKTIHLTWLGNDQKSLNTVELPNDSMEDLTSATYDENDAVFYLTIQDGSGATTETARTSTLYKVSDTGLLLLKQQPDTSKNGLNIVTFENNNVASLKYSDGNLGLILGRQMHESPDGLNHQGAIAVVFDAATLNVIKKLGQTSGHSFENFLTVNSLGDFVGIDLGDNYPRGVHLHKFDHTQKQSRVVYTFKTEHATCATSPAGVSYPVYSAISGNGVTYYQWSNDNCTYTELGGVIEGNSGYTIIFAGEATSDGRALDNSRIGSNLNDPRNIGLIQIISDFETSSGYGCVVTDDMVMTHGITESGGFYTFGGSWKEQRNTGVVWLTDYLNKDQENVSRLKAVRLNDGNILLLWEKWSADTYINTFAMKVSEMGVILTGTTELGTHVRLTRRDDILTIDNEVYLISGDKNEKKLEVILIRLK